VGKQVPKIFSHNSQESCRLIKFVYLVGALMPEPGWVIKFLRVAGEKIFVNLCAHAEVPSNNTTTEYR
jgi:hypothetical protein